MVTMMKAAVELTPEQLAKREQRARQREAQQSPAGHAAAAAKAEAEAVAKRESRRLRDIQDAETLREWAITDAVSGGTCELVDIGANLVKVKGDGSLEQQLRRCRLTGVSRVLVTGTSVAASRHALELVRQVRQAEGTPEAAGVKLFCTAGVHPHDAKSCDEGTLVALREMLSAPECVAVGECGLDYDRMFSPREVQLKWFAHQARLAAELKMPLFLHERDVDTGKGEALGSHQDLMDVLAEAGVRPEKACIHCFTGSEEQLRALVQRGYRIGLTGFVAMQERGAHVREALRAGALPLENLLLETDAPFMKPDKAYLPDVKALKRGQCEPCIVPAVCRAVAECLELPPEHVATITTANACAFFGLSAPCAVPVCRRDA